MYRSQSSQIQKKLDPVVLRILPVFLAVTLFTFVPRVGYGQSGRLSGGSIELTIYGADGQPLDSPARVLLSSDDGMPGITEGISVDGIVWFHGLPAGTYLLTVDAPGFQRGIAQAELLEAGSVEASVTLQVAADTNQGPASLGMVLALKAKAELSAGFAALQTNKLDEAQEDFEEAYNLAPGDASVNDALGLLFITKRELSQAQEYIERATSLDPYDVNALVDSGQLKLMQDNSNAAVSPLQKATQLAPCDKFAHWLLGIAYMQLGLFEKAQHEAVDAIKANKGKPTDAEFLLGQAEASLGRTTEAIKTLRKFVRQLPNDVYAPQARNLIAKLQTQPMTAAANSGGATAELR
ncbi:MAG TPA: tetratricopeptide repeat protein [Candidatus Aquilonibacter sp.]|nr:tetratricopeptide repeat protein [Candidatus Aquilonibacter sp.]